MGPEPKKPCRKKTPRKKTSSLKPFAWVGVAAVVFLAGVIAVGLNRYYALSHVDASALGDVFNVVNSLFSAAAFLGLIVAILLQREELQNQRRDLRMQHKELVLTRDELKRQAQAQEESGKALERQANTLLLAAHLDAITSLLASKPKPESIEENVEKGVYLRRLEIVSKYPDAFTGNCVFPVSYSDGVVYHLCEKTNEFEKRFRRFQADWAHAEPGLKRPERKNFDNYITEVRNFFERFQELADRKNLSCKSIVAEKTNELATIQMKSNDEDAFICALKVIGEIREKIIEWGLEKGPES